MKLSKQTSSGRIPPRPRPREGFEPLYPPRQPGPPRLGEADVRNEPWLDQRVDPEMVEVWEEKEKMPLWKRIVARIRPGAI